MINVLTFTRALPLLLLAVAAAAGAQAPPIVPDDPVQETEAPPRYTVEVIVFAYAEDVGVGTERFEAEPYARGRTPDPDADADVTEAGEDGVATPPSEPQTEFVDKAPEPRFEMEPLDESELGMQDIHRMLERLDVYEPLMHVGWTQTAVPRAVTPELRLDRLGPVPEGLNGTLELYLGRFVHLVVDLSLDAEAAAAADDPARFQPFEAPLDEYGDGRDYSARRDDDSLALLYEPLRYRIREDRIMKTGETRYFDHPRFGVIARVTRVEEDDAPVAPPARESG